MSADDSSRSGGRQQVGEALVAALGFEPTANVNGLGTDHVGEDGEATLERLSAQTVSVDERPAEGNGSGSSSEGRGARGSNGNGNGKGGGGNGLAPPGPGTRPNSRRNRNGGGKTSSSAVAAAKAAAATTASFAAEVKQADRGGATAGETESSNGGETTELPVAEPAVVEGFDPAATLPAASGFTPPGPLVEMPAPPEPPPPPMAGDKTVEVANEALAEVSRSAGSAPGAEPWGDHHIVPDEVTAVAASPAVSSPPAASSMDFDATRPAGFHVPDPPPPPGTGEMSSAAVAGPDVSADGTGAASGIAGRAGLRSGAGSGAVGVATDLASRVPQLVEQSFRNRSKVRARKVRRVVRHIDPWSVLAFSVLFHLCVFASLLLASVLVWNAADAAGTIDNIESFIRELGDYQTYEINGDAVFRAAMIIAGVLTLASSVMVVLLTVVFNLISDLIGGIRITVVEEEVVKVRRNQNQ
ncbi:MAG: DUF3566 domain-containing protein [Acidimicrobiales bacterium]